MRGLWTVVAMFWMSLAAWAQETPFNLLDDRPEKRLDLQGQGDKKQDGQTVVIPGEKYDDELPLGPYRRPAWTLHRVSPTTRVYLQVDPGEVEFEQWLDIRLRKKRSNPDDRVRLSQEFEFGLGGRFQLDLYYNSIFTRNAGQDATLATRSWAAEIRYALADWGVIPGNPTLYLEYILWNNQPDGHGDAATSSIEPKLLLSGEIAKGWHWGANFFYERTTNDSVIEQGVTATLIRTVIDTLLSVGVTAKFVYEVDEELGVKSRSHELYIGPSFQIRMAPFETETEINGVKTKVVKKRAHLDVEPIFGCTGQSDRAQVLLVFGWDF